jgi:hypothetical protein
MKVSRHGIIAMALAALLATAAVAQEEPPPIKRTHNPRLVGTAVLANIVYVPVRFALFAVGAVLGGFTGFILMGDEAGAESMWGLTNGSAVITPEMLEGTEEFHFTGYD